MRHATGGASIREVADRTGLNRETVRRYMRHGRPGAKFLALFCRAYDVDANRLLMVEDDQSRPRIAPRDGKR